MRSRKPVLGSGVSSEGEHAVEGGRNLYLLEEGHAPVFIAGLSEQDGKEVGPFRSIRSEEEFFGDWQLGLGHRTARVDGDGGGVVFMSGRRLRVAGFPGGVVNPGGLDEVFEFDAGSGVLVCVSCSRSGEAPPASLDGAAAFLPVSWSDTYLSAMDERRRQPRLLRYPQCACTSGHKWPRRTYTSGSAKAPEHVPRALV